MQGRLLVYVPQVIHIQEETLLSALLACWKLPAYEIRLILVRAEEKQRVSIYQRQSDWTNSKLRKMFPEASIGQLELELPRKKGIQVIPLSRLDLPWDAPTAAIMRELGNISNDIL